MRKKFKGWANKAGVYQIVNLKNGKIYIGSAKCFKVRANQHLKSLRENKHHNKFLQRSFNKWGEQSFLFEVLEVVEGDRLQRTIREEELLQKQIELGNWDNCFNFLKKTKALGKSVWSYSPEETKKIISQNSKKMWADPKIRQKILNNKREICTSDEYRKLQSMISKENWNNSQTRNNRTKAIKKALNETQFKEKQGKTTKKYWQNPEYRKKISDLAKTQWKNQDYKKMMVSKIKQANSKTWKFLDQENNVIKVVNLKQFCRDKGVSYTKMWQLGTGKIKQCGEYKACQKYEKK